MSGIKIRDMGGALRVKGLAQTNNKTVCPLAKACEAATSSAFNHLFVVCLLCFGKVVLIVPMKTLWVIEPCLQAMTILGGQQLSIYRISNKQTSNMWGP